MWLLLSRLPPSVQQHWKLLLGQLRLLSDGAAEGRQEEGEGGDGGGGGLQGEGCQGEAGPGHLAPWLRPPGLSGSMSKLSISSFSDHTVIVVPIKLIPRCPVKTHFSDRLLVSARTPHFFLSKSLRVDWNLTVSMLVFTAGQIHLAMP